MRISSDHLETKVNELLLVLDKDIEHIKQSLSRLHELRSLIIKRDEPALLRVLEEMRLETEAYAANESRRNSIRKELAAALGYRLEQMRLTELVKELPSEKKGPVRQKWTELKKLTAKLKKEHSRTGLLLTECVRFNRLLLKSILETGKTRAIEYDSNGQTKRTKGTAFVNLHF